MAAIDHLIARAVSLVVRRAKSAILLSSMMLSELMASRSSISFSRSAWYACNTDMVCRHAPAWPAAAYHFSKNAEVVRSSLEGKDIAFRDNAASGGQIARKQLIYPRHCSVTALLQSHDITVVIRRGNEEAGREWARPQSRHLGVKIGEERQAPAGSNSSSYWGDTGGRASAVSHSSFWEGDKRSA